MSINNVSFARVHRLHTRTQPQPIIARLTHFKDKETILKSRSKLKGTSIFINEDFTLKVRKIRKKLSLFVKQLRKLKNPPKVNMVFDHIFIDGERYNYDTDQQLLKSTKRDHTITLDDYAANTSSSTSTYEFGRPTKTRIHEPSFKSINFMSWNIQGLQTKLKQQAFIDFCNNLVFLHAQKLIDVVKLPWKMYFTNMM